MTKALFATYDGKRHLLIDEPLELPPETKVKIIVEINEEPAELSKDSERGVFDFILSESRHLGISDWAENHDHYLYGLPKRDEG
ncbi:MAG: hypothetical protein GY801_35025 [bacterium]|nr:hypothetical protein [bacterium]